MTVASPRNANLTPAQAALDHPNKRYPVGCLLRPVAGLIFGDGLIKRQVTTTSDDVLLVVGYIKERAVDGNWYVAALYEGRYVISMLPFSGSGMMKVFTMVSDVRDADEDTPA